VNQEISDSDRSGSLLFLSGLIEIQLDLDPNR
jgi:hypothetical protein